MGLNFQFGIFKLFLLFVGFSYCDVQFLMSLLSSSCCVVVNCRFFQCWSIPFCYCLTPCGVIQLLSCYCLACLVSHLALFELLSCYYLALLVTIFGFFFFSRFVQFFFFLIIFFKNKIINFLKIIELLITNLREPPLRTD